MLSSEDESSETQYINKSLNKSLAILDLFDSNDVKLSVTEIAQKFDTNPGSLYPILHTLEKHGYLHRDGNKQYELGLAFVQKSRLVLDKLELSSEARPELEKLCDRTNKTVHLACLNEGKIVYLDKVEPARGFRMYSSPGKTAPLHATALGKVILAHLSSVKLEQILPDLDLSPYTTDTITSETVLRKELKEIQNKGYGIDDGEFEEGIKCLAAPIHRHDGKVDAAISLTGLAAQMAEGFVEQKASIIKKFARKISSRLGYDVEGERNRRTDRG